MKTLNSTQSIRQSFLALLLIVASALIAGKASACTADFGYATGLAGSLKTSNSSTASNTFTSAWNFGDGTSSKDKNPTHTYAKNGKYVVCLVITDSIAKCTSYICDTIAITTACTETAYFLYTANKLAVSFFDSTSTALANKHSTTWDFGDKHTGTGDRPSHTYANNGTYQVCVTLYDSVTSCKSSFCRSITVTNCTLVASFKYAVGSGRTVTFTNTSNSSHQSSYYWYFGDGDKDSTSGSTAVHSYSKTTQNTYTVYLSVHDSATGCNAYSSMVVTLCNATSNFSIAQNLLVVELKNDSSNHSTVKYSWDFGDKTTTTGPNPRHVYNNGGTYNICLTAHDTVTGCSSTTCHIVTVNNCTLSAAINIDSIVGRTVYLSVKTNVGSHRFVKWYFGDNTTDSIQGLIVKHTYTNPNNSFNVYLSIMDSVTKCQIYINKTVTLCTISSNFTFAIKGSTVTIKSDSANKPTVKFVWDFNDKTSSRDRNPTHTYKVNGTYNICLTATDSVTGCNSTTCHSITINNCSITLAFDDTISGHTIYFMGKTNASSHKEVRWIFGDGSNDSISGLTTKHTYSSSLTSVNVYLRIYDSTTKCVIYATKTIAFCKISATFTYKANLLSISFAPPTSNPSTTSYTWSFGDGHTSTDKTPTHVFGKSGTYQVCLTAGDSGTTGCHLNYCQTINVNGCTLSAEFRDSIVGRKVYFTGKTNGSVHSTVIWSFGDKVLDSTSGFHTSHTYGTSANSFTVYMRVYDPSTGCLYYASKVISFCHISAHFVYAVSGNAIKVVPDSTNSTTAKYYWSFGDGSTSKDKSPAHTYKNTGTYHVCLYISDSPCVESYCDSITIKASTSTYCIHGRVSTGKIGGAPCEVYLITFNAKDSSLSAVDSVTVKDTSGNYEFCGLKNGTYYTKAALLHGNSYYKYFIPTYHNDATKWATAKPIVISGASVTGEDIKMRTGTNTGGAGFIGGKIKAGANKTGDPQTGVLVILYDDAGNPVNYTYSDADGNYSFAGVQFGTYTVEGEIPGKVCYPAVATVSDTNATLNNVNLNVNINTITPDAPTSGIKTTGSWIIENVNIYPNPVSDKLIIATNLHTYQDVNIQILDIAGRVVLEYNNGISGGKQTTEFDASALHPGMYFIRMQLQKDNKLMEGRFVKVNQ